jgi:hypothetical protein
MNFENGCIVEEFAAFTTPASEFGQSSLNGWQYRRVNPMFTLFNFEMRRKVNSMQLT